MRSTAPVAVSSKGDKAALTPPMRFADGTDGPRRRSAVRFVASGSRFVDS